MRARRSAGRSATALGAARITALLTLRSQASVGRAVGRAGSKSVGRTGSKPSIGSGRCQLSGRPRVGHSSHVQRGLLGRGKRAEICWQWAKILLVVGQISASVRQPFRLSLRHRLRRRHWHGRSSLVSRCGIRPRATRLQLQCGARLCPELDPWEIIGMLSSGSVPVQLEPRRLHRGGCAAQRRWIIGRGGISHCYCWPAWPCRRWKQMLRARPDYLVPRRPLGCVPHAWRSRRSRSFR